MWAFAKIININQPAVEKIIRNELDDTALMIHITIICTMLLSGPLRDTVMALNQFGYKYPSDVSQRVVRI